MAKTDSWKALRPFLGATFIKSIDDPDDVASHPLIIGSQSWSRHALATELGIVHTQAARHLSAFALEMKAKNVQDLWARSSMYQLAREPYCGVTTLYVAWRVFEYTGLDASVWYQKGRNEAVVTYISIKARLSREKRAEDERTNGGKTKRTRKRAA